ncbi:hypothetical protein GX51_04162 [Blastomyces parvus]|uniref:Uncharacterized protein n=1 Tax=Blastomyces parvus TaxID=2060905 RepID=A0A2B7X3G8_9EURO|nr:hypothetical protein GX51_04162 [Blastomyces parvus]
MHEVIYHWLSKVGSRDGSPGRPRSSFTRRKQPLDTKRTHELCDTRNQGNEQGHGTEPIVKINHAPQIDRNGSLPLSDDRHIIATMDDNRDVPDAIPGMQSWNGAAEQHYLPDAHSKAHDDGEPRASATEKARLRGNTSQTPCAISQAHVTSNHDSKNSKPPLSNVISRGSYDRRPRYKTRLDRYELKDTHPSTEPSASGNKPRKLSQIGNVAENLPKDTIDPSFPPTSTEANRAHVTSTTARKTASMTAVTHRAPVSLGSSADKRKAEAHKRKKRRKENRLEHNFRAPNVTQDRLSLPVNHGVGFLEKARAGHTGVPDLSFSGMGFLTNGVKRPSEPDSSRPNRSKRVKEDEDQGRISRYFSKQPAGPLIPECHSIERNAPQALSRQPNTLPLLPEVDANGSAGTEPPASELVAGSVMLNAGARLLSEASLNPPRPVSNPLLRRAHPPRDWLPQGVSRMLDSRRAMLVAAKSARNIAMLDKCRKAVQHAAQMVSHEDRAQIDAEVERDYPIAKLASGFSLHQTKRAIEKMIRGENRVLAEICTLFDSNSENADFSDAFEEAQGAGSVIGTASSVASSHHSGPLTTHTTSNNFQRRSASPGIKGSPKAPQNAASSSHPSQQPSAAECNATSPASHLLTSHSITRNQPHAQAQPGSNERVSQQEGTLRSVQLSVPVLDSTYELTAESMTNPVQCQLSQNMNDDTFVMDSAVSIGLSNIHRPNNYGSENNQAWRLEPNTGNPQPPFLQNARKQGQPYEPEIEASTNDIHNGLVNKAGSIVNSAQGPSLMQAESSRNRLVPQQSYAIRPHSYIGPMVSANPLVTNAKAPSYSVNRYTEQANSQHLSIDYSPCVNSGDRPTSPALSLRSGFSNIQSFDNGWVAESNPERFIEQHLLFDPSNTQHGLRQPNLLHTTSSSPTVGRTSTASRSGRTVPLTTPWYNNQTTPWTPSSATRNTQSILNSYPEFVYRDLFPKSYEFGSAPPPPSYLPFSHPNKLH